MGFWIIAGALTLLIGAALWLAVLRPREEAREAASYDLEVYRQQLKGVERDLERGVVSQDEAARIRTEVGRRVLEADRALQGQTAAPGSGKARIALALGLVALLGGAVALYLQIGAPGYPDLPLSTRIAMIEEARAARPSQAEVEAALPHHIAEDPDAERAAMVAELRRAMELRPDDPEGLRLLANEEARIGNFRAARNAQSRLIAVLGEEAPAEAHMALAEFQFRAANGYISPETEAALGMVLAESPGHGAARYYVGLMYAEQGRADLAWPIWRDLLADSPPDAPWLAPIRARIEQVAAVAGEPVSLADLVQPPLPSGPTAEEIAAAEAMAPEDRAAMIEGMVAGLAARLAAEGGPAEDWARLISAQIVLGNHAAAEAIYAEALGVFAGREEALATIRAAGAPLQETGQ